ncbi:unnamed protein product [Urochloa humidicola]
MAAALERMKADVHNIVEWKDDVDKDLDELKIWKSSVSSRLDNLIREHEAMRWSLEEVRGVQETLQNKQLAVLSSLAWRRCSSSWRALPLRQQGQGGGPRAGGEGMREEQLEWMLVLACTN